MAEEKQTLQEQVDTTQDKGAPAEGAAPASTGSEIDDLREAMKKSDWVARLVSGDKKVEAEKVDDSTKEKTAAVADQVAEAPPDKPAEKKADPVAAEEKPKKKPARREDPPQRADVDVGVVAEAAAEAAARAVGKMQAEKSVDEIPENIKKREDVYKELEQIDPKKYSGIMRRMVEFSKREEDRADAWERAHPGELYDADAEEHKAWYDLNEPKIDQEDLEDARVSARANKIIEQRLRPEIDRTRIEVEKTRVEPVAVAAAATVTEKVLGAFVDGAELTRDNVKKLIDSDPDAYEIAVQVDSAFRPIAAAVPKLYRGVETFDGRNQAHVAVRGMVQQMETELAKSDRDQLTRGGKTWVPLDVYYNATPEKRQGYWCVSEAEIATYVALTAQQEAKSAYENHAKRLEEYAKRHGWVKQDVAKVEQNGSDKQKQDQQKTAQQPAASKSPSVGSAPAVGVKPANAAATSNDPLSPLWTRMGLPA